LDGNALFLKYWKIFSDPVYKVSPLPGIKKGISGSTAGGSNLGICIYSEGERREAAITALQHITSKKVQREQIIINNKLLSPIPSLYDEKEVCDVVDCDFFKSIQYIPRPTLQTDDYDEYSTFFRKNIYDFLYGNKTAAEVLQIISNLNTNFAISIKQEDSNVGLFTFLLTLISIILIMMSLLALLKKPYEIYFKFLSNDLWIISVIGCVMIMCVCFLEYGSTTSTKCQMKLLLFSISYSLNVLPILYKLIENYQDQNKICQWIKRNKYLFLSIFIGIDVLLNGIAMISWTFKIEEQEMTNGQIFQRCIIDNFFDYLMITFIFIYKLLVILCITILTFIEWNINTIHYELKFIFSGIMFDLLYFIFIIILNFVNIKDGTSHFIIQFLLYYIISISNYIYFYGFCLIFALKNKENKNSRFIESINNKFINSTGNSHYSQRSNNTSSTSIQGSNQKLNSNQKSNNSKLKTIIQYHYQVSRINNNNNIIENNNSNNYISTTTQNYSFDMTTQN